MRETCARWLRVHECMCRQITPEVKMGDSLYDDQRSPMRCGSRRMTANGTPGTVSEPSLVLAVFRLRRYPLRLWKRQVDSRSENVGPSSSLDAKHGRWTATDRVLFHEMSMIGPVNKPSLSLERAPRLLQRVCLTMWGGRPARMRTSSGHEIWWIARQDIRTTLLSKSRGGEVASVRKIRPRARDRQSSLQRTVFCRDLLPPNDRAGRLRPRQRDYGD